MNHTPTFGDISCNDVFLCSSLEPPWLNNEHNISCIPLGSYTCHPILDHKTDGGATFKQCFQVLNVPDREGILIHPGNRVEDTHGCILVGIAKSNIGAIINSKLTLSQLWTFCGGKNFTLEITDYEH